MSTSSNFPGSGQTPSSKFNIDHLLFSASQRMAKATSSLLSGRKPGTSSSKSSTNRALTGRINRTKSANTSPQRPLTSSKMNQGNGVHPYFHPSVTVQQTRRDMVNRPSSWHPGQLQAYHDIYQQQLQASNHQQQMQQHAAHLTRPLQPQSATNSMSLYLPHNLPSPQELDPYRLTPFYPNSALSSGVPFYSPALSYMTDEETSLGSLSQPVQDATLPPVYPESNHSRTWLQYNDIPEVSSAPLRTTESTVLVATKANRELVSIDLYSDPRPDRSKRDSQSGSLSLSQLKLVQPWEPTLDDEENDDEEEEAEQEEKAGDEHATQSNHIDLTDSDDEAEGEADEQAQPTPQGDASLPPLQLSLSKQDLPTYDFTYTAPYANPQNRYIPMTGYYPGLEGQTLHTPPQWPLMAPEPQQYAIYRQEARYSLPLDQTRMWV